MNKYILLFFFVTSYQTVPVKNDEPFRHIPNRKPFSAANPIKVAVIDTGFDLKGTWISDQSKLYTPKLCAEGHTDFTNTGLKDNHGHGTHIAGLIAHNAYGSNYCLVILKFWDKKDESPASNTIKAFKKAIELGVDVINYSAGGEEYISSECEIVKTALDMGIKIVVAAGNESKNINIVKYWPAMCDDRLDVVANVNSDGKYSPFSNFTDDKSKSKFLLKEQGSSVFSILPDGFFGIMTGTSQAAAIHTGKLIKSIR